MSVSQVVTRKWRISWGVNSRIGLTLAAVSCRQKGTCENDDNGLYLWRKIKLPIRRTIILGFDALGYVIDGREKRLKNTLQRTIVTTVGLLLLLTIFTTITACSGSQNSTVHYSNSNIESSAGNNSNSNTETRDFTLSGDTQPTLIANNDVGSMHVQPGSNSHNMHVKVTKFGDNPSDIQVNYSQSGNSVTITIKRTNTNSNARAEADITLPSKSDLQLQNGTGDIAVTGIEGKMSLTDATGTINATQISLTSSSQLQTATGNVNFSGSIGGGNYQFQSSTGDVDVSLPSNASFHADAKTAVGTISSDFSSVTVQQNMVGASASGTVGSGPSASITLTTATGSIHLKQS